MSLRESYGVPSTAGRLPPLRMWLVILAAIAAALVLWLVLPDSPITVAVLVIVVLGVVFTGVAWVLRTRGLNRRPGRNPRPIR
jgi:Flp pilus assembly protein TadB